MKRPNILILYTDQQRWDALGANGNPDIKTPNLDRLAASGVNFDHYFVQNPVCMPSRASFLTSQYPSTLGITHMGVPLPEETLTLPRMTANAGYVSANIGKLHFRPHGNRDHRAVHPRYGFDHLEISEDPGSYEDAYRAWVRAQAPDQLDRVSVGLPPATAAWQKLMRIDDGIVHPNERFPLAAIPFRGSPEFSHTAFVADQTLEFIRAHRGSNWLCVAGFFSPHSPWVAPQPFLDLYDPASLRLPVFPPEVEAKRAASPFSDDVLRAARHGYYAMVSEVDHHVGRILAALEREGLAEETLIVFTSDHGDWLGEHLRNGKGYPGPDCVSRVPLIIRPAGGAPAGGRRVEAIVEAVDVIPTLLECCAIQAPPSVQGRSLAGWLRGESEPERAGALMEHAGWKTLRTRRYRYVAEAGGNERLFDLENDPGEYRDVAGDAAYAEALGEMRRLLLQRVIENERPLPRVWPY